MADPPLCGTCGVRPCIVRKNGRPLPACSECWGPRQPIGTTRVTDHGYRVIKTQAGWRFEHIVVAESILGRPLRDDEQVGWLNGNKTDNDPANLVIGVTRFRPLVEAPKRPKDRTGEKHKPRVEIRPSAAVRVMLEWIALRDGTTPAAAAAEILDDHEAALYARENG